VTEASHRPSAQATTTAEMTTSGAAAAPAAIRHVMGTPRPGRRRAPRSSVVRPSGGRPVTLLRLPAFWMIAGLLVLGAGRMGGVAWDFFTAYPVAFLVATLLFALYAVPFWLFVSELDYLEREPPLLQVTAFAWGGLVATSVSIAGNGAAQNIIAKLGSPALAATWGPATAGPAIEEITKTLGVVAIVLIARGQVNSVLDGIVYGALVGLGFQIVENVVFAMGAVAASGQSDTVRPVVTTFLLRGFLAGLWSHTLFSALAGAGIGHLVVRTDQRLRTRVGVSVLAVLGAWLCHFLWNAPLLGDGFGNGGLAVLAVLLLKGLLPLILVLLLIRAAHDREADYYVGQLAALDDPEVVTPRELRALGSGARRAGARWHAHARAGHRAHLAVRRLQRAQAQLAVALSRAQVGAVTVGPHTSVGPGLSPGLGVVSQAGRLRGAVRRRRAEVLRQRRLLTRLGHPEAYAPAEKPGAWRRAAHRIGLAALAVAVVWTAVSALGGA
jgi:protease PrsW